MQGQDDAHDEDGGQTQMAKEKPQEPYQHAEEEELSTWLISEVGASSGAVAGAMAKLGVETIGDLQTSAFDREVRGALMAELANSSGRGGGGLKLLHRKKLERALVDIRRRGGVLADEEALQALHDTAEDKDLQAARVTSHMTKAREELCEWHGLLTRGVSASKSNVPEQRARVLDRPCAST